MIVKELIYELFKFNQEAKVVVTAHCKYEKFTIGWESGDAPENVDTKKSTKCVSFYVDGLCIAEQPK